jgi:hypothetical protein
MNKSKAQSAARKPNIQQQPINTLWPPVQTPPARPVVTKPPKQTANSLKYIVLIGVLGLVIYLGLNIIQQVQTDKLYAIDDNSGTISLGELKIGSRIVDRTWQWEHDAFSGGIASGERKPVVWIVVAKDHYEGLEPHVTLLAEELIGRFPFDNSTDREIINFLNVVTNESSLGESKWGDNNWGNSGTTNATKGLRPWLNSTSIHAGDGFYHAFSESFRQNLITTAVPNKASQNGESYTTQDKVFIPSITELGASDRDTYNIGKAYQYFSDVDDKDRIAKLAGNNEVYWTRSPSSSYADSVMGIGKRGSVQRGIATHGPSGTGGPINAVRPVVNLKASVMVAKTGN